ncbi:MAG: group 1 truncated hemoglobin [Alphaproteobacteria bacterium]|nr:group 1 truncated hemoglobin [Alphaproteobacteria bacterium]
MDHARQLYQRVGGREGLRPVIERFYDKMFSDPWLGQFFHDVDKEGQQRKLEDFLCMGIDDRSPFKGNFPMIAHAHMLITQPMLKRRTAMLREAVEELGHPPDVVHLWLQVDAVWHSAVRKTRVSDCDPRLAGKPLKVVDDPPDDESSA